MAHMDRITIDPAVMGGVPCLRGLRIPVSTVVNMVAGGMTAQQIVDELPPLEIEDVAAALRFAADAVADREIRAADGVKFLIDQNRSPRLASLLRDRGHDAVHTLERAEDDAFSMLAAQQDRVIVSGDTGFGALLALLRRRSPSVMRSMRLNTSSLAGSVSEGAV